MEERKESTMAKVSRGIGKGIRSFFGAVAKVLLHTLGIVFGVAMVVNALYAQIPDVSDALDFHVTFDLTDTTVYEQLDAISELAVYEYRYTNHVDCTSVPQLLGREVWATDHWFAFDYSGIIKVGCNFDEIKVLLIDPSTRTVILLMPAVSVLSNEISIDLQSYQDRNNVCNPLEPREVLEYLYSRREPEQKKAIEQGIIALGTENAQRVISLAIRGLGYDAVFR